MAATQSSEAAWEEDEWEPCNDDGFVYKRRKRRKRDGDDSTTTSSGGATVESEAELRKRRRTQKKKTLIKLKDKYTKEIVQWEHLSNTLRDMMEKTQNHQEQQRQLQASSSSSVISQLELIRESSSSQRLVNDLLFQVEAQGAMIQDLSDLCDIVETMCKAEEERLKQSFFDLPIWGSPRSLLASLSDPDYLNDNVDDVQTT